MEFDLSPKDSLHKISNPIFWKEKKKLSTDIFIQHAKGKANDALYNWTLSPYAQCKK